MTKRIGFPALAALTLGLGAVGATGAATKPLAERYNAFGFELFSKTVAANAGRNVVVSPTSVAIALAMAQNGAAAKTRAAIAQTLHAGDLSDTALNADNAELLRSLAHPGGDIEFSIANSLWIKNGFPVHVEYTRAMERSYHAKVANINFDAAGLAQLNGWVKEHTLGLIPKVLDSFEPLDSVVLANALALKAKWLHPFDPHATSAAPFHVTDGLPRSVSMMRQSAAFEYTKGSDWQLVRLPYRGNRFSMYVFLPANASVPFSYSSFERERAELRPTPIFLQMPRFVASFNTELNVPLAELGMGIAFDPSAANFSRLTSSAVHISRVAHVTYVRVDEAGTQAAAVTAVVITKLAVLVPNEHMVVDHPFYMILRDDRTGQILFLGHINNPQ
jgi:serine protease inhibitor